MHQKDLEMLQMYRTLVKDFEIIIIKSAQMNYPPRPPPCGAMEALIKKIQQQESSISIHEYRRKLQKMADYIQLTGSQWYPEISFPKLNVPTVSFRGRVLYLHSLFPKGKVPPQYDPGLPFLGD